MPGYLLNSTFDPEGDGILVRPLNYKNVSNGDRGNHKLSIDNTFDPC
jgi:hypothetical protein